MYLLRIDVPKARGGGVYEGGLTLKTAKRRGFSILERLAANLRSPPLPEDVDIYRQFADGHVRFVESLTDCGKHFERNVWNASFYKLWQRQKTRGPTEAQWKQAEKLYAQGFSPRKAFRSFGRGS